MYKILGFLLHYLNKYRDWVIYLHGGLTYRDLSKHLEAAQQVREDERKWWKAEKEQWRRTYHNQTERLRGFIERESFGKQQVAMRREQLRSLLTEVLLSEIGEFVDDHLYEELNLTMVKFFERIAEEDVGYKP